MKTIAFFSMFSPLVWLKQHSTMPHKFVQTGLLEEVSEYQLQYPRSCNSSQESPELQHSGSDFPAKSQRLTGQLLADKVIPWRLKLQELFFFLSLFS